MEKPEAPPWNITFEEAKARVLEAVADIDAITDEDAKYFDDLKQIEMSEESINHAILGYCRSKNYRVNNLPFHIWDWRVRMFLHEDYSYLATEDLFIELLAFKKRDIFELWSYRHMLFHANASEKYLRDVLESSFASLMRSEVGAAYNWYLDS